jgi:uncharacterized protein YllA (UPF0747 family)
MNRFVLDWLGGDEKFLPRSPSPRPRGEGGRRPGEGIVEALDKSNRHWGSFISDELRRWSSGETITLIAGQQVGFAGGPLYTLAKIASLIRMKRDLESRGQAATIFFWLATEDHDFDEAATLQIPVSTIAREKSGVNRQLDLLTLRATRAVESKAMVGPAPIPEGLIAQLLSLYDMDRPTWLREGITFRDSFAELIATAVSEKIIFIDALLPELRAAGAPLFDRMRSLWSEMQRELHDRSHALEAAGYTPQVKPRDGDEYTLLFEIGDDGERRISRDGTSTSALTRPILQDYIFQPDVFIGGPAEVAYYAQLAPLHSLLGVTPPRVALRGHALVAPKRVVKLLDRYEIRPDELFNNADAILAEREPDSVNEVNAIAEEARKNLAEQISRIGEIALPAEHALARAITRSIGHIEYHFDKLAERAIRGLVRKDRDRHAAVRELVATFFPDKHVQDRVVAWFGYWCTSGSHLVDRLVEEIEPDTSVFKIISL